jgi:hypothetical protein
MCAMKCCNASKVAFICYTSDRSAASHPFQGISCRLVGILYTVLPMFFTIMELRSKVVLPPFSYVRCLDLMCRDQGTKPTACVSTVLYSTVIKTRNWKLGTLPSQQNC